MKRRKLAAKIGRDVRGWWTKIEKVISYKQKTLADEERQAAMNKQLVVLVQQTEKYTESLTQNAISEEDDEGSSDGTETGDSELEDTTDDMITSGSDAIASGSDDGRRRRRRRRRRRMTIEEALAAEPVLVRTSKKRVIDYSRMKLPSNDFYGESTASDASGSDGSYSPDDNSENDSDDDSTFQQAMHEELKERNQDETSTFLADPEELRKLREEVSMDVDEVMERLRQEADQEVKAEPMEVESSSRPGTPTTENKTDAKNVHFSETIQETAKTPPKDESTAPDAAASSKTSSSTLEPVVKYDADDDADASDVEDYDDAVDQRSDEEFEAAEPEADDETTMAQEESLPREISADDELALLQKEGELSIEELRKMYANLGEGKAKPDENRTSGSDEDEGDRKMGFPDVKEETEEDREEFEPIAEVDDETTLEAEEKLGRDMTHEEEMAMLKGESEIPIEKLRAMYANATESEWDEPNEDDDMDVDESNEDEPPPQTLAAAALTGAIESEEVGFEGEGAEEFEFIESEAVDDETTLDAEERLVRDMSYEDEISLLKRESEMSVEELRAKYAGMENNETASGNDKPTLLDDFSNDAGEDGGAEEFEPDEAEAVDDETTLEAEERLGHEMSHEEEMSLLKRESEVPVEDLRAMYARMETKSDVSESQDDSATPNDEKPSSLASELFGHGSENDDEEDFAPNEADAVDDETTMEAEERLGREMSHEEEIDVLKREGEMSVEDLRKLYAGMNEDGDASDGNDNMEEMEDEEQQASEAAKRKRGSDDEEETEESKAEEAANTSEDGLAALTALEASAERAQHTLATRPFLIPSWVKLRIYQQVGLNWLVSLQSRRLNGILADGKLAMTST
jgi:hypothetical protein